MKPYLIPKLNSKQAIQVEQTIEKSRFLSFAELVNSREESRERISYYRELYPDARHHCWAYIVGCPGATTEMSMSDDGEPAGTAGKPMLNVLQHSGVGDIVVVVVRYFGGVKLGTGGLVRAYSSSVQQVLEELPTTVKEDKEIILIHIPYELESMFRREIDGDEIELLGMDYAADVLAKVEIPSRLAKKFCAGLVDQSNGRIYISEHEQAVE